MGPGAWAAALLVVLTQWKSSNLGLSIVVGVGAVAVLRPVLG
jgi:branched-subunit amino acid transport protein